MKRSLLQVFLAVAVLFSANTAFGQGTTSSSLNGRVTDANGESLPGATVVALHTPSGSQYGNITNADGYYRIPNMRVGGPYTVTITFVGYREFKQENVFLTLGQGFRINAKLTETSISLEDVEVVAERSGVFDGNRTGAETVIGIEKINSTPTVARAIGDFARFTPQATLQEGNDGFSISIGGQNNRYNAIYIDGAVNNDVFGLAGSGTNGGQTGVSPISVDAIEQFQIAVAPFDVRQSGFAGGSINAVTRSGSNELQGSVYNFWRNEGLAGKTPTDVEGANREKLAEFSARTTGFRLGGPIIKDKLFFFVNAEIQRDETPQPFDFGTYEGDASSADITALRNYLGTFGYDPGTIDGNPVVLNSDKITAKIDYNINQNHKISARYGYVEADNIEGVRSSTRTLNFYNRSESFLAKTNSLSAEWSGTFGPNISNKLTVGYTAQRDDRDPLVDFPTVNIRDGRGFIRLGAEEFSTANLLNSDVVTINNNFEWYKGNHTFTAGINAEFYSIENLFIAQNYGRYLFASINDFVTNQPAIDYFRLLSNRDDVTGDGSMAAANFNSALFGIYFQDEFQANDNLKLTYGLRLDRPSFDDTPVNDTFNNGPLNELGAVWDTKGATIGEFIPTYWAFSPRFGFNWDINGDRSLQLRGGAGIFTSRIPLVWPGGSYNNNGFNLASIDERGFDGLFVADPFNQPGTRSNTIQSGNIDLFASDFKIPQVAKFNVAVDKRLSNGWIWSVEGLYTKTIHAVRVQNINIPSAPDFYATGTGDLRGFWNRRNEVVQSQNYGRISLTSNTGRGFAYNFSSTLTMPMTNGFQGSVTYSYGDAWSVFDGTSSQNSSQWRGLHSVNSRNIDQPLQRSNFSQGHRVIAQMSYRKEWNENLATQIGLVYEGQSGRPFSYVYADGDDFLGEDSRNRTLVYVPLDAGDIVFDEGTNAGPASIQWQALNNYIANDEYLNSRRGQYVERNADRAPWVGVVDLRFLQDFTMNIGGNKHAMQFTADVMNFSNMLNSDWGRRYFVPQSFNLLNFEGFAADGTTPTFTFNGVTDNNPAANNIDDSGLISSRWQMQLGLRYTFGN